MSLQIPRSDTQASTQSPMSDSEPQSCTATMVDLNAPLQAKKLEEQFQPQSDDVVLAINTEAREAAARKRIQQEKEDGEKPIKLSQLTKWSLLALLSLAFFIDIWAYSAFFIFTDQISTDLDVQFEQQSWVITSYAVTFSSFLLFWGRVSDLYSPKPVFSYGFIALGIINLVISFLPEKFSFFVLRAISGIAGATLIPAAFRLIVVIFEPEELNKAFTIYGLSGALANVSGLIVAGFISYIPGGGQMTDWRWFFRIMAIVIMPCAIGSLFWIPKPKGENADVDAKWKRMDFVGILTMLFAIVLLILGLTLGASYGFKTAKFLVPFLISWVLFPFFFWYESRLPEGYAVLPSAFWKIPNMTTLIVFSLFIYGWWSLNFLPFVELYTTVEGEKPIIAAVRLLPQGISALIITVILTVFPTLVSRPRFPIIIGMILGLVAYVLFIITPSVVGTDYWRYLFPAFIIGSGGTMVVFTGTNVGVMTSAPSEMAGVAGAVLQVALQVGSAVALSIQAGLFTINPGSIANYENVKASFYFELGWIALWFIGFVVFYRPGKTVTDADQAENGERKIIMAH